MAKRHSRPSPQYRYEHYDPRMEIILYQYRIGLSAASEY
jgi:hypothetical protein